MEEKRGQRRIYLASELRDFFGVAQHHLEELLSQAPKAALSKRPITREFHFLGHGKTGTNKDGKLTGWSGDMPCHTYEKKGTQELGGIELALAQAGIKPSDDISKAIVEAQGIRPIHITEYYLRFVSDLPRAIAHALLLTGDKKIVRDLERISKRVTTEMSKKGNIYNLRIYQDLIKLAIANGFVPVPALRAQYYGPMELGPEKLKEPQREKFVEDLVKKVARAHKGKHFDEAHAGREAEQIADALIHRKDLLFAERTEEGRYITENRPDLVTRVTSVYDAVRARLPNKQKALFVTSSGCVDVVPFCFRYIAQGRKDLAIGTPKKVRGKVVVARLTEYQEKTDEGHRIVVSYANDPNLIKAIKKSSIGAVAEQRKAAFDEDIKKSTEGAIIPVELLRFEKREGQGEDIYTPVPIELSAVLASPKPSLWLGNFGQGKSTAAIELTERLNTEGNYVAVLVTAAEINRYLHNSMGNDTAQNDKTVLQLLSRGTASLPQSLRDEHKFVFVIDALDEVLNYRSHIIHAARDQGMLRKYGKVIVTSRFLPDFHEYENPGFTTLHLDPQSVPRNLDQYLGVRIPEASSRERFKDFLMQQDEGVKTNYLLVYFLTNIYNQRPQELGELKGTVSEAEVLLKGIEVALWDNKLPKRQDLKQIPRPYNGQTKAEAADEMQEYEHIRTTSLGQWMGLAKAAAAYMTTHDLRSTTRKEIEGIVSSSWCLAKYAAEQKR